MSLTRKNVGAVTRVPMKASAAINMGGFVCVDSTGYAVAGADTSGLRFIGIAAQGMNNDGLDRTIKLANNIRKQLNAHGIHAVLGAGCHAAVDDDNLPVHNDCVDLASLKTLTKSLLDAYDAHEGDAELGAAWVYHIAQEGSDHSLSSTAAPTNLSECMTRLNDLKAKFNAHDADATCHTTGSLHQVSAGDGAATSGDLSIPVWTQGVFKITGSGLAVTDVGKQMYAAGAATIAATSTNGIEIGLLKKYISATSGWVDINANAPDVGSAAIADGSVTLVKLATGCKPTLLAIAAEDAATMTREENIAGLSSAITLALEAKSDLASHFANATRHTTGQQSSSTFNALPCTTKAELLALVGAMLTAYAAHNADAILAGGWAYHNQQAADKALVSAVTPTTLVEAITRLNDLKAKYNDHEDESTGHNSTGSVVADQVAASDAAYGTTNRVTVTGAAAGDKVQWAILNDGTGNVTGVSATPGTNYVDFEFSADPQNDAIISYAVFRTAT